MPVPPPLRTTNTGCTACATLGSQSPPSKASSTNGCGIWRHSGACASRSTSRCRRASLFRRARHPSAPHSGEAGDDRSAGSVPEHPVALLVDDLLGLADSEVDGVVPARAGVGADEVMLLHAFGKPLGDGTDREPSLGLAPRRRLDSVAVILGGVGFLRRAGRAAAEEAAKEPRDARCHRSLL